VSVFFWPSRRREAYPQALRGDIAMPILRIETSQKATASYTSSTLLLLRCVNVQVCRRLRIGYASILDQAYSLKLELPRF